MKTRALGLLALVTVGFSATQAQAQELRYSTTAPGGVVAVGNTLGLSKASSANGPGTLDSIGTFIAADPTMVDDTPPNPANPWPMGTTSDWMENGSTAVLTLPSEVDVLYAELLWGGSYQYVEDVTPFLDMPVSLELAGQSTSVTPDPTTALTVSGTAASGFAIRYYMRSADVTSFVEAAGDGTVLVSGIPATQTTTINSLNAAGWTLVVVYRDQSEPTRNLSVFVGGSFVDEDSQQDYSVNGFCAPSAGTIGGTAVMSAIEGDANLTGDQFLIAPTAAGPFVNLSGPNNPATNFFCSQMNDAAGLDTQGSFGNANHDAIAGTNISGGRQGWDVTTIPLSSANGQLVAGQTSAVLRTITTGDSYMPILASFAIDVNSPDFTAGSSMIATPEEVTLGDSFSVTAMLQNTGDVAAENTTFKLTVPPWVSLTGFESDGTPGDIQGVPVDEAALVAGVDEGSLDAGASRTVTMSFTVDSTPPASNIFAIGTWSYEYEVCAAQPLLSDSYSQSFTVDYIEPMGGAGGAGEGGVGGVSEGGAGGEPPSTGGAPNASGGSGGAASTGGTADTGGSNGDGASDDTDEGCNCRAAGTGDGNAPFGLAGALAVAWAALRRRRRSADVR
ncbi:MAG: hypothetical protein HOW73_01790 [Polyangiaceae bacterium]|nr:hypothetical protein [Polyangiaceae bacterium]